MKQDKTYSFARTPVYYPTLVDMINPTEMEWSLNSFWPNDVIWWHTSESTLAQVMVCCLMALGHFLNQCWLPNNEMLWSSFQGNFYNELTNWGWDKMAAILRTIFSNAFSFMKTYEFCLRFVSKVRINNILALVQIMAWHRPGDKP